MTDQQSFDPAQLQQRVRSVLTRLGTTDDTALEVASHLVRAEQSGHASHGVLRLPQYAAEVRAGTIDPAATTTVVREQGAAAVLDAHHGFGHAAAADATARAARAASTNGLAAVAIRDCTHVGRLGEYAERLGEQGFASIVLVGAAGPGVGSMAAFGSTTGRPFLNTNPWAIGFPSSDGPVVFDAAMSVIPEGKVHAARARGQRLPEGALLDRDGNPSTDPDAFLVGGTLTPLGGASSGHKGYGLALAAALFGGLANADGSAPVLRGLAHLSGADGADDAVGGVTVIAIDSAAFGSAEAYSSRTTRVGAAIRADGSLVPGDLERQGRDRSADAVVLPTATVEALADLEATLA